MLTCRIQIEFARLTITVALTPDEMRPVPAPLTMRESIERRYRSFAEREARGRSPLYETLAFHVADDEALIDFLAELPEIKQQPNLLFGAGKYMCGAVPDWPHFKTMIDEHREPIRHCMMTHATQTNEAAR